MAGRSTGSQASTLCQVTQSGTYRRSLTREQVDRAVNVWLDVLVSTDGDLVQAPSILARLIDFQGEIPRGSGYYPTDVVMISAAATRRPLPADYDLINGTVRRMLRKHPQAIRALVVKHGHVGVNEITGRAFTHEDRGAILGVSLTEFKHLLKVGYKKFSDIYLEFEEYENLKH